VCVCARADAVEPGGHLPTALLPHPSSENDVEDLHCVRETSLYGGPRLRQRDDGLEQVFDVVRYRCVGASQ